MGYALDGSCSKQLSYIFTEKSVTQFRLVWKNQLYTSSISVGAHQEKTSLVFWLHAPISQNH